MVAEPMAREPGPEQMVWMVPSTVPGENKGLPCCPWTNVLGTAFLETSNERGSIKRVPLQKVVNDPSILMGFSCLEGT